MTDIVERLRNRGVCSEAHNSCRNDFTCEMAADEIERLRKALKFAAEWGVDSDMGGKNPVSAALRHWIKGGMYGPLTKEQKGGDG